MQTVAVQIQDGYMKKFISYVNSHSENITITKDSNLEYDPYFYERKKQLQQDINDIDNGKVKMINNEDFWDDIDSFTQSLQK
ncbi:MAG: hypothetical protein GQ570_01030 [Helicobacteraceae bacterium]|nr:hypothetical protein [Helicobacteraceae bacterium]